jgi:hypothetical protein
VLRYRAEVLRTAAGRADGERALVKLAARLDSSPALWSVDPASAALSLPGYLPGEIEVGLAADRMGPLALFDVAPV